MSAFAAFNFDFPEARVQLRLYPTTNEKSTFTPTMAMCGSPLPVVPFRVGI